MMEEVGDLNRRCVAQIVRVGLEREAEQRDGAVLEVAEEGV